MSGMFDFDVFDGKLDVGGGELIGAMASGNPWMAGLQVLGGLFGGGSVKISKAAATGSVLSGETDFKSRDRISMGKAQFDLTNPQTVLLASAVVVGAVWLFKKKMR